MAELFSLMRATALCRMEWMKILPDYFPPISCLPPSPRDTELADISPPEPEFRKIRIDGTNYRPETNFSVFFNTICDFKIENSRSEPTTETSFSTRSASPAISIDPPLHQAR